MTSDIALLWSHPAGKQEEHFSTKIFAEFAFVFICTDSTPQDTEASVFSRHIVYTIHEFMESANSKTHAALADNDDE